MVNGSGKQSVMTRVVAAVIERDGKFLVCQRPKHKRHGGRWEFPGGKVQDGESDSEAVRRELREELALSVVSAEPLMFSAPDPASGFHINFIKTEVVGQPSLGEHESVIWATPDQLSGLLLAPADKNFSETILRTKTDCRSID